MEKITPASTLSVSLSSTRLSELSGPTTPRSEYEFQSGLFGEPSDDKYILVTGGLGYIGSHTTLELLKAGYNVVVIDDLSNSYSVVLERIKRLVSEHYAKSDRKTIPTIEFHQIDYRNAISLRAVLDRYSLSPFAANPDAANRSRIFGVIHFAAYKAVSESIRMPLAYYSNNVAGFIGFLETLSEYGIKTIVFSSSATVYGEIDEEVSAGIAEEYCVHAEEEFHENGLLKRTQQGCHGLTSPYGRTKWMCESILWDLSVSDPEWRIVVLRYFNPIGCDPSGLIGEDPLDIPNNLMPVVCKVLRGEIPVLNVFGSDYHTWDGTGVRDFIHVCDLANGHLAALRAALDGKLSNPFRSFNLGTGQGYSVLQLVDTMKKASGRDIPLRFTSRRKGDVAMSVAKPLRASLELGWKTERELLDCCIDTWNFLSKNPLGYKNADA